MEVDEVRLGIFQEIGVLTELKLGDLDAAFNAWEGALDIKPESSEVLEELIRLAEERNDSHALLEYGRTWFESHEEDDPYLLRKVATAWTEQAEDELALRMWTRVLEMAPEDHDALSLLAANAEEIGDETAAAELYGRLASSEATPSDRQMALVRQAAILEKLERYDDALAVVQTIATMESHKTEHWLDVYRIALRSGRQEDAAQALDVAIQRSQVGEERLSPEPKSCRIVFE